MGGEAAETVEFDLGQLSVSEWKSFGFVRLMLCDSDGQFADQNYSMRQKLSSFSS